MDGAVNLAFGAATLDRAAHIRADQTALKAMQQHRDAGCIAMWRGKPLMTPQADGRARLEHLPMDHATLQDVLESSIFLGLDQGRPRFAIDLSHLEIELEDKTRLNAFADLSVQQHAALPRESGFVELRGALPRLEPNAAAMAGTARALIEWHRRHRFCANCGAPSVVSMGGWQRDCPSCGANHYPRTDPVVIVLALRGNAVLMGRSPAWPAGLYSLLAGFVEPGETIGDAARREVFEESGIRLGDVQVVRSQPWPFPASLMMGCVAEAHEGDITIDPAEIEEALWVSKEEMVEVIAGRHPTLKPARRGAIARVLIEEWIAGRLTL